MVMTVPTLPEWVVHLSEIVQEWWKVIDPIAGEEYRFGASWLQTETEKIPMRFSALDLKIPAEDLGIVEQYNQLSKSKSSTNSHCKESFT